jgi:hypothetical protein
METYETTSDQWDMFVCYLLEFTSQEPEKGPVTEIYKSQPSVPVVLVFNSLVCTILFAVVAFVPWSSYGKAKHLMWRSYFFHGVGAGLFFALGNSLWYYCVSNHLIGNYYYFAFILMPHSIISNNGLGRVEFLGHALALD